jgi:hypothetical protein
MTAPTDTSAMVPIEWLQRAFAMRAQAYAHVFDVLRERFGADQALALLSESTRRLGTAMGGRYAEFAPGDLAGLRDAFLSGIPAGDVMFQPEVQRCDTESLEIQFHRCPLKETWQAMGRSDEDLELLCRAAGAIDQGLFGGAGFTLEGETWQPGRSGCCLLRVKPGPAPAT